MIKISCFMSNDHELCQLRTLKNMINRVFLYIMHYTSYTECIKNDSDFLKVIWLKEVGSKFTTLQFMTCHQ